MEILSFSKNSGFAVRSPVLYKNPSGCYLNVNDPTAVFTSYSVNTCS